MENIISKELLSEVLDTKDIKSNGRILDNSFDNTITYQEGGNWNNWKNINIHELAHKCKEWSTKQSRYFIYTRTHVKTTNLCLGAIAYVSDDFYLDGVYKRNIWNSFQARTEAEAIFKACQWILENKG